VCFIKILQQTVTDGSAHERRIVDVTPKTGAGRDASLQPVKNP
jgi:hypothetical protein